MTPMKSLLAALAASLALPAFAAEGVTIRDAYARVATPMSASGAAFMVIENHAAAADRLIDVSTDVAERAELHTHREDAQGVMQMLKVEEGFAIPAGGEHALARGGDHVMLMGLRQPLMQGDMVTLTLHFEQAGDLVVEVPVDLERMPTHEASGSMPGGHGMQH